MAVLSERDAMRIALEIGCSTRTVRRWGNGEVVSACVKYACDAAAAKLRIKKRRPRRRRGKVRVKR